MDTFDFVEYTMDELVVRGIVPIYLNASSLKLTNCDRKYAFTVAGGFAEEGEDAILSMGRALHKYAEVFTATKGDVVEAITAARRLTPKNLPPDEAAKWLPNFIHVTAARNQCAVPEVLYLNGQPCVEVKFSIPWLQFQHNGITYCFVVCGTIDQLSYDKGRLLVIDYKSTRYWKIEDAIKKWSHEVQFKFYLWALWKFGHRILPLDIYPLLRDEKAFSQICFIQLSGTRPKWSMNPNLGHMTTHMYETYERQLRDMIPHLANLFVSWLSNPNPQSFPANGMLSNSCAYCQYNAYCHATSAAARDEVFSTYQTKTYNPIEERE